MLSIRSLKESLLNSILYFSLFSVCNAMQESKISSLMTFTDGAYINFTNKKAVSSLSIELNFSSKLGVFLFLIKNPLTGNFQNSLG